MKTEAYVSIRVSIHAKVSNSRITISKFDDGKKYETERVSRENTPLSRSVEVSNSVIQYAKRHSLDGEYVGACLGKGEYLFTKIEG